MDIINGFITELTAEKRGPKKHYRRFNLLTSEKENISGWIFSTTEIENTTAGNILLTAANNNAAVCLRGKITSDEGGIRTIKVSINSKLDKCIEWATSNVTRPETILSTTSIRDALLSNVACRLEAIVLDEHEQINFIQNEKERKYKIYIIGDSSGTTQILVYDDLIDNIIIGDSFIFTQIKWKKILDKIILTTSPSSTISGTTNILIPNLEDMDETMSIKLIDVEEFNTSFEEIIQLKQENICSSCKQNLTPIPDKQHLLKCNNCSKYSLMKNNDFDINVIIHMYEQNLTFHTTKGTFQQLFQEQNPQLILTSENLSEYFLMNGPWKVTLSHFRRELTNIKKI